MTWINKMMMMVNIYILGAYFVTGQALFEWAYMY